jgi:hypothetical protein
MGPTQHPPKQHANQERSRRRAKKRARRPRLRRCLLKGCQQRFQPKHPWSRYCGHDCRNKARRWSRWKAQKRYRATGSGKQHRKAQSGRNRQRNRARKTSTSASNEAARVITAKILSTAPATGRVATCYSYAPAVRRCSDSVHGNAGVRWSVSWSGNGAGGNAAGRSWSYRVCAGPFARPDDSHRMNRPGD